MFFGEDWVIFKLGFIGVMPPAFHLRQQWGSRGLRPLDLKATAGGVGGGLERPDAHR